MLHDVIVLVHFLNSNKSFAKHICSFSHPEGNFYIDAGDGDGGDHLGPHNPPNSQKRSIRKLFTLLGHFSTKCQKIQKHLKSVTIHKKYTESDKRI